MAVHDQYIISPMGGKIAINQLAIHKAMDLYDVADRIGCFDKVVLVSRKLIAEEAEEEEE